MCSNIKPIRYSEKVCFKCLSEENNINKYVLSCRGYGSIFDSFNSIIQLCENCNCEDLSIWVNESPVIENGYVENYKYEDKLWNFVNSLPLLGRELFENQCADGAGCHPIDSQDWIDIELGVAPDSLYKEYDMYSPSEIKAYEDRFPTCENVYLKTYADGSKTSVCRYGASGNEYGECSRNISIECYTCKRYSKKGFDILEKEDKDLVLNKSNIKKIELYEWTCEVCGEITHTYNEYFICPKCNQLYDIEDTDEYVYCTECIHFKVQGEGTPYCENKDLCDLENCEDSMAIKYRPYYRARK